MKNRPFLLIFCFLLLQASNLQSASLTDSLEIVLRKNISQEDRFKTLMELANEIMNSDKNRAIKISNEAETISDELNNNLFKAQVLLLKGRITETEGKNEEALNFFIESNILFEQEKDFKGIGQTLNNIGIVHWYNHDYDKAIEYFNQAYDAHKKAGDKYGMSTNRVNKAIIYDEQGKYEEALTIYKEALEMFRELNDEWSIAACNNNIGLNYTETKQFDLADSAYREALRVYRKLKDLPGIASALNNIGYNLLQNNKYNEAIPLLLESLEISEKEGYRYDQRLALLNLANSYNGIGKFKEAFEYHKKYSAIKDSILNKESNSAMKEMEARFSNEMEVSRLKQEQEMERLRREEEDARRVANNKIRNVILLSVLGIILITAGLFYQRYQQKKKDNIILLDKNHQISLQKTIIEEKNKDITDSIQYAKTIQDSVLPDEALLKNYFTDSFILFLPRDIVSGDFFWFTGIDDKIIFTVGDCTGHGVPGSLMSMMGINLLHQIIREEKITDPATILTELDKLLAHRFSRTENERSPHDGMDIAIGVIDKKKNIFSYSSALRPVYFVRENEFMEFKSDMYPIGGSHTEKIFKTRDIDIRSGDLIYFTTDGLADQFGGEKGKKFMTKRLKGILLSLAEKTLADQKQMLVQEFISWKGSNEQVDDICVMGIKV